MIHVVATIAVKPGTRAAYLAEMHKVVGPTRAEAGCHEYGPTVDVPAGLAVQPPVRDDVVTVIEKWADVAALKAHLQSAHMTAYREAVKDMVTGVTLHVTEPA